MWGIYYWDDKESGGDARTGSYTTVPPQSEFFDYVMNEYPSVSFDVWDNIHTSNFLDTVSNYEDYRDAYNSYKDKDYNTKRANFWFATKWMPRQAYQTAMPDKYQSLMRWKEPWTQNLTRWDIKNLEKTDTILPDTLNRDTLNKAWEKAFNEWYVDPDTLKQNLLDRYIKWYYINGDENNFLSTGDYKQLQLNKIKDDVERERQNAIANLNNYNLTDRDRQATIENYNKYYDKLLNEKIRDLNQKDIYYWPRSDTTKVNQLEQVARDVLDNRYWTWQQRRNKLIELWYDPSEVQDIVNQMVKWTYKMWEIDAKDRKQIKDLAKQVMNGKFGNWQTRRKAIEELWYDYNLVQQEVDKMVRNRNK